MELKGGNVQDRNPTTYNSIRFDCDRWNNGTVLTDRPRRTVRKLLHLLKAYAPCRFLKIDAEKSVK
jgi:hypothetical protein